MLRADTIPSMIARDMQSAAAWPNSFMDWAWGAIKKPGSSGNFFSPVARQNNVSPSNIVWAGRIARAIVAARGRERIDTARKLASIVRRAAGRGIPKGKGRRKVWIDPATKTFMALRIYVNDELGEVERSLPQAVSLLRPDGVIAVISSAASSTSSSKPRASASLA